MNPHAALTVIGGHTRLPSCTMLPQSWPLIVIDLKDCFFTIPLCSDDAPCFAFLVPSINNGDPCPRYHWTVLPQGMKNSPTICQQFVAGVLSPVHQRFPDVCTFHYMDDILVAAPREVMVSEVVSVIITAATQADCRLHRTKSKRHRLGYMSAGGFRRLKPNLRL